MLWYSIVFFFGQIGIFPIQLFKGWYIYLLTVSWSHDSITLSLFNKSTKKLIFLKIFQDFSLEFGTKKFIVMKICNNYNYHHSGVSVILFATRNQEILFNDFFYLFLFIVIKHLFVVHKVSLYKEVYCDG